MLGMIFRIRHYIVPVLLLSFTPTVGCADSGGPTGQREITLRAWGVPTASGSVGAVAQMRVLEKFRKLFQDPGGKTIRSLVYMGESCGGQVLGMVFLDCRLAG